MDSATGDIYCNDVGQALREEINLLTSGGNYGWPYREGTYTITNRTPPGADVFQFLPPIASYGHLPGELAAGLSLEGSPFQLG